jgi:hypothetical protein
MGKSTIRVLTVTVCAALVAISVCAPANAAASGSVEVEKGKKRIQKEPLNDPRSARPTWPPPMYDDFDRKNAGGGGGM